MKEKDKKEVDSTLKASEEKPEKEKKLVPPVVKGDLVVIDGKPRKVVMKGRAFDIITDFYNKGEIDHDALIIVLE